MTTCEGKKYKITTCEGKKYKIMKSLLLMAHVQNVSTCTWSLHEDLVLGTQ